MRYLFVIILSVFLVAVSSAQVDTLQLMEIGSIQPPSGITELYVEDLDGDSLKEIIFTTATNVHIYNGITYQQIWVSPALVNPRDLNFADINNDSLVDFSVKDAANIYLYDPHNSQTIWTSPPLDSMYKCYTIGDRNDDDWMDVAIVSKEWFMREGDYSNLDTVWVDLYDGPSFHDYDNFILLFENWYVPQGAPGMYWLYWEIPLSVAINKITANNVASPKIVIFSNTTHVGSVPGFFWIEYLGNIWLINSDNYSTVLLEDLGSALFYSFLQIDSMISMYMITDSFILFNYDNSIDKRIITISADTLLESEYVWRNNTGIDWQGYIVDDISINNVGLENCYAAEDTLALLRFPEVDTLWIREVINIDSVLHRFADSSLYDSPLVICTIRDPLFEYQFFSGSDGSLSAVLPYSGYELSQVLDLDNDQRDEILSIQANSLYIYNLDYATGIGDDSKLPYRVFLRHNYPNPFNSSTTIEYGLPEAEHVRIDIYDLLGRKVETLVDEEMQVGRHRVVWDASAYSSGIYFYRIEAGDFADKKRMVYLK